MGWRTDEAYENDREKAFQEWKASLTWREWLVWQWSCWRFVVLGAAMAAVVLLVVRLLA